jgi:SnoaL-like domain
MTNSALDDVAHLERQVAELTDRNHITNLVYGVGACLDDRRFDEMPSLLVEAATVRTPGGAAEGRQAVIAQARRTHQPDEPTQHVITNPIVELDGDRARVRANLVVNFAAPAQRGESLPAPPRKYTLGEIYHFDVVRDPGGVAFLQHRDHAGVDFSAFRCLPGRGGTWCRLCRSEAAAELIQRLWASTHGQHRSSGSRTVGCRARSGTRQRASWAGVGETTARAAFGVRSSRHHPDRFGSGPTTIRRQSAHLQVPKAFPSAKPQCLRSWQATTLRLGAARRRRAARGRRASVRARSACNSVTLTCPLGFMAFARRCSTLPRARTGSSSCWTGWRTRSSASRPAQSWNGPFCRWLRSSVGSS